MSHISFSGMKLWNECPYKYKLAYIDKAAKFEGNIYTAFGSAMHTVCEKNLLKEWKQEDSPQNFIDCFFREIERLPEAEKEKIEEKFVEQMIEQGKKLAPEAIPYLKDHFGEFEILSSEENLMESIEGKGKTKFKGFVDLFIKMINITLLTGKLALGAGILGKEPTRWSLISLHYTNISLERSIILIQKALKRTLRS